MKMGCDIHGWVEVKDGNKYIAIIPLKAANRNYRRFAALAGVRDYEDISVVIPKGIPLDASDTVKYYIEQWGIDGHSHSYMPLSDAAKIFLETENNPGAYERKYPESYFFDYEENDITKARLVFWFDN